MRSKILAGALALVTLLCSFSPPSPTGKTDCFTNFTDPQGLKASPPQRLPERSEKIRQLPVSNGTVDVSRVDGYRVLYNNGKGVPFVNLKVEVSDSGRYERDTTNILANLLYLTKVSRNMESPDLIRLTYNGCTIYGLSRNSIDSGSLLGSFVMFPGKGLTVYFDFNNLKPDYRNFQSLDDYKSQRNRFLGEYTAHVAKCGGR